MDREGQLLENLYGAAADAHLWPRFLDAFAQFFDSTGIALFVQDYNAGHGSAGNLGFAATARMDAAYLKSFDEHYSAVNPWLPKMQQMKPGVPVSDVALLPRNRLVRSEWYADWLRPQGYDAGMGVMLARTDGLALNMTVHRSARVGDYSAEELRALQSFAPHIQRAIALHAKLSALDQWKSASYDAFDKLRLGVVFIDRESKVVFVNLAARKTIGDGKVIRIDKDSRVAAVRAKDSLRLKSAIKSALDPRLKAGKAGDAPFRMRFEREAADSPVELTVLPLPRTRDDLAGLLFDEGPAAVLFITDPDRQIDLPCAALIAQYGFTAAEALLAQALVRGTTLNQYASARGITRNTVMTQLKAVMAKTGKTRQVDVVSAILTGPVWTFLGN